MKYFGLVIVLISYFSINAQEIAAPLFSKIPLKAETFVGVDEFQSVYYINNNILYKKSKTKIFSYSNFSLGKITTVNIQNPFKLILFYQDFNAVMIVDNNLNELTEKIDFTEETLFNNVLYVTGSSQNNIWLYADDNKLHLYDYKTLSEQTQTQPLTFYEEDYIPKTIISTYKNVWILSNAGVLQFNEYGNFIDTFEKAGIDSIYPFKKNYIFSQSESFFYQKEKATIPITLNHSHLIKDVSVNNAYISIYDGEFIYQYELNI